LAGVGEISIVASLLAVLAFAVGATLGGRLAAGRTVHRGHLLAAASAVQAGVVLVASVIASTAGAQGSAVQLTLVGLLALAMGGPERGRTPPRRTGPDHDRAHLDGHRPGCGHHTPVRARRLISVLAMLAGALTGGVLLRWVALAAPLWLATGVLVACSAVFVRGGRPPQAQTWR
jgi:hypothetical protein